MVLKESFRYLQTLSDVSRALEILYLEEGAGFNRETWKTGCTDDDGGRASL
jgi:hypothetical protein